MSLRLDFGGGTRPEMRLVLSAATFAWLTKDRRRIDKLATAPQPVAPADLLAFMQEDDPQGWRTYTEFAGLTDADVSAIQAPESTPEPANPGASPRNGPLSVSSES